MRKQLIGILALASMVLATFGTAHPANTQASSGKASSHALGTDVSGKKVVFIIYSAANVQFFAPVVQGAEDAAKVFGLNLSIEYGDSNNVKQNNLIETAIAQHASALAVSIPDDNAFTKSICDVAGKGIPVVSFNVDATKGPVLNCRLAFVGQDFVASGALIAQRMINDKLIKAGDHVYCPVEAPQAVYAISRYAGVKQALGKIGATCDLANSTFSLADAQTAETQYLLGHRNTKAIIGLGSVPLTVAPKSVKAAGMNIPIGGFDLTQDIIKAIQTGTIVATVDQQPYAQGYYPVAQLALDLKYGLHPSSMNTGAGLVDKSNVNTVATLAGPIR